LSIPYHHLHKPPIFSSLRLSQNYYSKRATRWSERRTLEPQAWELPLLPLFLGALLAATIVPFSSELMLAAALLEWCWVFASCYAGWRASAQDAVIVSNVSVAIPACLSYISVPTETWEISGAACMAESPTAFTHLSSQDQLPVNTGADYG